MTSLDRLIAPARRIAPRHLGEWLYQRYFIGWRSPVAPPEDLAGDPVFVAELSRACDGAWCREGGFSVVSRSRGGLFVARDGLTLFVPSVRRERGGAVSVALPCARPSALPGFFSVVSRAGRLGERERHLKFYVNATTAGAVALLSGALKATSLKSARFEAKCANDARHFGRRDTLLFYVSLSSVAAVRAWLVEQVRRNPKWVRSESPPMTAPVCRGVSSAESPLHGESFGAHRTRLIAEGLRTAFREVRPWRECVAERFEREGLDWRAPDRG